MVIAIFWLYLLNSIFLCIDCQILTIQSLVSPDGCFGGQICVTQPAVVVLNKATRQIEYGFVGDVYVQIGSSPTGYETLYIGGIGTNIGCDLEGCGQKVFGTVATATFIQGVATFQKLFIKEAGYDYTLKFIARTSNGDLFAQTFSNPFNVYIGDPYKLTFKYFTGVAFGGIPFSENPTIAVVDRGGNTILSYNNGYVTASLTRGPNNATDPSILRQQLLPQSLTTVSIEDGLAVFEGLYINKAGYPYQITFEISLPNELQSGKIVSRSFDVVVGPVAMLEFVPGYELGFTPMFAGEYFSVPPKIRFLDAGGNHVIEDSTSGVLAYINNNPVDGAFLGPIDKTFSIAKNGIVTFTAININKRGFNYTILFTVYDYSALEKRFFETSVSLMSAKFNVDYGSKRKLVLVQHASGAWAGGQAFSKQPILQVQDYGGNVLKEDVTSVVKASMVESLSVKSDVVINTANAPITPIRDVKINLANASYGAGQVIDISISFDVHVWVQLNYSTYGNISSTDVLHKKNLPYLILNVQRSHPTFASKGNLPTDVRYGSSLQYNAIARLTGVFVATKVLVFRYVVLQGDSTNGKSLDYINTDALKINNSTIEDGNHKEIDNFLPYPGIATKQSIIVDTTAPKVIAINTNTSNGEYGAGQVIDIYLTFDKAVHIEGVPYISLSSNNASYNTEYGFTYHILNATAIYSHSSDDNKTLHFFYTVKEFDNTDDHNTPYLAIVGNQIQFMNFSSNITWVTWYNNTVLGNNTTLPRYDYTYNYSNYISGSIKQYSTKPTTFANYDISKFLTLFSVNHKIVIDTSSPKLDTDYGIRSNSTNGTFFPGHHIYLTVRFNKPVVTFGDGIALKLYAGPLHQLSASTNNYLGYAYIYKLHSDFMTMEFLYVVENNVNISRLDLAPGNASLIILQYRTGFIHRKSTHHIKKADLSTFAVYHSSHSLKHTSELRLYGYPPVVSKVALLKTHPFNSNVLYPGDYALIKIIFSAPISTVCKPVLVMMSKFYREATYVSGNGSETFIFNYTVLVGDQADQLQYRHTPYALCSVSGCPYKTQCDLFADSTVPSLPANLKLPRIDNHLIHNGVSIPNQNIRIDGLHNYRSTRIISIKCQQEPGVYGAGSVFHLEVIFSDIIIVNINSINATFPLLHLTLLDKFAYYSGGSHTRTLLFTYISTVNDVDISFQASNIAYTNHALKCRKVDGCKILNQANVEVDLNTTSNNFVASGIILDPTPPHVLKVWSNMKSSPYKNGDYSVGEKIYVYVEVSAPVIVTGFNPRIVMNVSEVERYAEYVPMNSTSTLLVFIYSVMDGDYSPDITYLTRYIDLYGGGCIIYRLSSIPTTLMDVTLPPPEPLAENNQIVRVNTFEVPKVLRLNILHSNLSTLYAGDSFIIRVEFSIEVIAIGRSYIQLNFGDHYGKAFYVGYNSEYRFGALNSNPIEFSDYLNSTASNASRYLFYQYSVEENDYTGNLDYVDTFSLISGITDVNDPGLIVHASSSPRLNANLELPQPGSPGSLSAGDIQIRIDGRAPYLTRLFYLNPSGIYSVEDQIYFGLEFSASVCVIGGIPSIKMETGLVDNFAIYTNGSGTNVLYFAYQPEPGDHSVDLDYHSERILFSSAVDTFHYNGAVIVACSGSPFLNATILLNPPSGFLEADLDESPYPIWLNPAKPIGGLLEPAIDGVVQFNDLKISRRGPDYLIRYSTEVDDEIFYGPRTILSVTQNIDVSFSSEIQLVPKLAKKAQLVGHAVDIEGDIAVLGCPNCNSSIYTIQTVTTSAAEDPITREIQLIRTYVLPQPGIQSFHTTADVGVVLGGYYRIMIGGLGPTRGIPANADPEMIQAILKFDLPSLGNVTVTRKPYIYCACENAFIWIFVFNDINEGVLSPLVFDTSMLIGSEAAIVGPVIIQSPALLAGTFTLSAFNLTTTAIPYDAGVDEIVSAIAKLGIPVFDVFITPTEPSGSRSWSVTFDAYLDSYEIPLLESNGSNLTGGKTSLFVQISRPGKHGPYGIAGYFALKLRGDTTELIPSHASAAQVKSALESLPTINFVNVERTRKTIFHGYTWTIEFVEMMEHTPRGLMLQDTSNIEPLQYINHLIATDATIQVQAKYQIGSENKVYSVAREGTYGAGAGAVHIFQRHNESWDEMTTLRAKDTVENNRFGSSVAISGDVIIVGAEGANLDGIPEIQSIFCSAISGSFIIKFRGWETDPISYNVTRKELIDAIISDSRIFSNLYTIRSIYIDEWGGGGLCDNNTAIITFYSPVSGDELLLGTDTGPDLELLTLDISTLMMSNNVAGILTGTEVQKGSWIEYGINADKQQYGAAYIFRAYYDCLDESIEHCYKYKWVQEAKLFPPVYSAGSRFGYSVALTDTVALVGAPGSLDGRGAVYAFEYNKITKVWSYAQQLILVDEFAGPGDHFGSSIAISGDTVVISALNYIQSTGGAFIFSRPLSSGTFIVAQNLGSLLASTFPLIPGDLFGMDITIEGDYVLVGSPGFSDKSVYLGDVPSQKTRKNSGAVFSFSRKSSFYNFYFYQKLAPSNVKEFDGFGFSLKIDGDNLIVSSLQNYEGDLISSLPVVEIKTTANYNTNHLGGSFKLKWTQLFTMEVLETRQIPFDASASAMQYILQVDLQTGPLMVSRSPIDVYDGGYAWSVTFMNYEGPVALFQSDTTLLTGDNSSVTSQYLNRNAPKLRGKAHIFQRISVHEPFVEQLFVSPYRYQPIDRCGQSVSISGRYALMGCPNRDLHIPGQNSGAGFIFDLGLLAVEFSGKYTVKEGNQKQIEVVHDYSNILRIHDDLYFYVRTFDKNSFHEMQIFIQNLFGLSDPTSFYPDSMVDRTQLVGKAVSRAQYYGSIHNESKWVDGMYDYRAISDYVPINNPHVLLIEKHEIRDFVTTTDDTILEVPDEYIILAITSPGIWPSVFGRLYGQIRIYDPLDGTLRDRQRYNKLYDSMSIHTEGISETSTAASLSSTSIAKDKASTGSGFGNAIRINDVMGVMMVGAPSAPVNGRENAGKVLFYRRDLDGNWTQQSNYYTSPLENLKGTNFGAAVALSRLYDRNISILAIGEPSLNRVYVYSSVNESFGITYNLEAILSAPNSDVVQERYGDANTISIYGYILVVGAPGLESILVYRRSYNSSNNSWKWIEEVVLHSSDYDFDIINGVQILHRQNFGSSVSTDPNTILVGAPFADYDKLGSNLVEVNWDTEGTSILSYGRGKAYIFYSSPGSQEIVIDSPHQLRYGQFRLRYTRQGISQTTDILNYDILADELKLALMNLANIDIVKVSSNNKANMSESERFIYSWTITFISDWEEEVSMLEPLWYGFGCPACAKFSILPDFNLSLLNASRLIQTNILSERLPFQEIQSLSAQDRRNGDRFGASVAIDGNQIVIGAPNSCGMTSTTWDFEAGALLGWHSTGDAFDFQPTFGDNSLLRGSYSGQQGSQLLRARRVSSGLTGRYYIGTYDKRPGDPFNYQYPNSEYPEGNIQGDAPRGTLSSDVFIIRGSQISFLIGGGCDPNVVFVELLIDGLSVAKQTGKCDENMKSSFFDVSLFYNKAAQIRIVDNSTANWGHINVDAFEFNWNVAGATIPGHNQKTTTGGVVESAYSGVAYLFYRGDCNNVDPHTCEWFQEAKFSASDKRSNMQFGSSVALNSTTGTVFVGAANANLTGFYKEVPSVYPYLNASDASNVANLKFPFDYKYMDLLQSFPLDLPERSGANAVWNLLNLFNSTNHNKLSVNSIADERVSEGAGAVYVFIKKHAKLEANGEIVIPHYWYSTEHSKIQLLDASAHDGLGVAMSLSDNMIAFGVPGHDGLLLDAGAIYLFRTEFTSITFSQSEYPIVEGTDMVAVTLLRDLSIYSGEIAIEYATSDLSAKGVDNTHFEECMSISVKERNSNDCGDYLLTSGVVYIPDGVKSGGFTVRIMNDLCYESFQKYIQITLSVPGSAGLQSDILSARIRIDDDDFEQPRC